MLGTTRTWTSPRPLTRSQSACAFSPLPVLKVVNEAYRFHPDFYDGNSKVQSTMLGYMHQWVEDLGVKKRSKLERLTKQSVREHKNILRQGETGVSQALINPLGLPTLEDLASKVTSPSPSVGASVVGTHQGKPVYFNPGAYGKGDTPPISRGADSSSFSSLYSPSIADSEASSQDRQGYQWTPGVPHEGRNSITQSIEDFYSAQRSNSSPATSSFYSSPPDPSESTEDFYSSRPDPQRSITTGYTPSQRGPSQSAQDFYSSPKPNPPQFQSPVPGSPQQSGDRTSKNPFYRQMASPPQPQSRGMEFYAQSPPQGSQPPYNPYPPQIPQMSAEAASFYGSPPPQPPPPVFQPRGQQPGASQVSDQDGRSDPLAELAASIRKF